ncbi:NAD(P)/FAD-dependent oxidoreductase [Umboniibacter marinipuniceus]|uniref:Flavin-dependent dehydrogenase n=1 Tax=Umboniibacter marinipuniceus TaxID=569599 RepID=A0A3M0AEB1_9GAMM|nr:NAD(P)/FAD-dependent oxidoreductase [Umboniibacter marinipuniceus]RMA82484.1 flavin-dependent dehydrogenase [Umboniibacter marinipuniceus]
MEADVLDVVVIGAGPSGTVAAKLLHDQGLRVEIVEAAIFPRFVIGESLLPQCNMILREAGLYETVAENAEALGFQRKNGAAFEWAGKYSEIDFREKFSDGDGETWQVRRGDFDKCLADEVERSGVVIRYGHRVTGYQRTDSLTHLNLVDVQGCERSLTARFVVDGSGYGRVLPRLLSLDEPSDLPSRKACFTHIEDHISASHFDREKILVTIHPDNRDVWFWLIPFADGRASIGVVGEAHLLGEGTPAEILRRQVSQVENLSGLLEKADWDSDTRTLESYSTNISSLYGDGYCVLGNAGEFLDPVFSSGVTIAMKSASLAAKAIKRELAGETVDWSNDFETSLLQGVRAFKTYVMGWYDGRFQDVIFYRNDHVHAQKITTMISSVLAGYAWDLNNPFVKHSERKLNTTAEIVREAT